MANILFSVKNVRGLAYVSMEKWKAHAKTVVVLMSARISESNNIAGIVMELPFATTTNAGLAVKNAKVEVFALMEK